MPVESANGLSVAEDRIDEHGAENAGEQRANRAPGAVHAEGIKGIIVSENGLEFCDHPVAERARNRTDDEP